MVEVEAKTLVTVPWKTFTPDRADARLVGQCGEHLAHVLMPTPGVREVYVVEGTIEHYYTQHGRQFDVALAEAMMPFAIADPIRVYRGKPKELVLFGEYDPTHYLIVPLKALPGEMWVSSLFIDRKGKALRKWDRRGTLLYAKKEEG
ncbi:MAG: hypothetical protein ACYC3V_20410 [Chloroflexota bacterium]